MSKIIKSLSQAEGLAEHAQSCSPAPKWAALIDDTLVPAPQREVCASVLLAQAGVEPGKVLVRDHGGEEDVAVGHDELVDLARGNVFYVVSVCDGPPQRSCTKPAKLALFVDDRPEVALNPNQTGKTVRELFGLREDVNLVRDTNRRTMRQSGWLMPRLLSVDRSSSPAGNTRRSPSS